MSGGLVVLKADGTERSSTTPYYCSVLQLKFSGQDLSVYLNCIYKTHTAGFSAWNIFQNLYCLR